MLFRSNNYYPFGLKHKGYNANINGTHHKYMFGGKEYDESFQTLNTYDFGARNYDPALGRWMNVDPLAEQMRRHSPYNYAFDNPIFFIDPDGRAPRVPKPPFGGNPLYTITGGFQQLAQETGRLIDKAGAKLQTFFSFGGETTGNSNNLTGSISNETITTISIGTNFENFSTPTANNKPSVSSPFTFDINTTNETKVTVSGKITIEGVDVHTKNVTSTNTQTREVKNNTTVTIGKDQTGLFVKTGTSGTTVGVRAEQKVSAGGKFIKFGGELSVGNK